MTMRSEARMAYIDRRTFVQKMKLIRTVLFSRYVIKPLTRNEEKSRFIFTLLGFLIIEYVGGDDWELRRLARTVICPRLFHKKFTALISASCRFNCTIASHIGMRIIVIPTSCQKYV